MGFVVIFASLFVGMLCDLHDGGKAPRLTLNDGTTMPAIGMGTFAGFDQSGQKELKPHEVEIPVKWAIEAGYRLFDSAQAYKNEDQVGLAVRESSVPREHIFVVTKLASHRQREPVAALNDSLKTMNLTYVDLYLIHSPVAFTPDEKAYDVVDYIETWKGMEEAKRLGLARSIGISNFNVSMIERLLEHCEVKPSTLQVEVNLNLAQTKIIDFCKQHNITVMAYTPFGSLLTSESDAPPPRVNDEQILTIAAKYGKTVPQVALRYLVQRGVVPIPKSFNKSRIEENINIFDFELTPQEIDTLSKFNKDYRTVFPSFWQDHPYYPYEKKDIPDPDPFKRNLKAN